MRKFVLFFLLVFMCFKSNAQQKKDQDVEIISHQVEQGETVRMLSQKYLADPKEIYKLNKFAVDGIRSGMVLQIPVTRKAVKTVNNKLNVGSKNVENQSDQDSEISEIPQKKTTSNKNLKENPVTVIDRESHTDHVVKAGESLASLSGKYNISVDEIRMSNVAALKKGFKIGQVLKIPATKILGDQESSIGSDITPESNQSTPTPPASTVAAKSDNAEIPLDSAENEVILHTVEAAETLKSLSIKYKVSVKDIKSQNPSVGKRGLYIGQQLKIRKRTD